MAHLRRILDFESLRCCGDCRPLNHRVFLLPALREIIWTTPEVYWHAELKLTVVDNLVYSHYFILQYSWILFVVLLYTDDLADAL